MNLRPNREVRRCRAEGAQWGRGGEAGFFRTAAPSAWRHLPLGGVGDVLRLQLQRGLSIGIAAVRHARRHLALEGVDDVLERGLGLEHGHLRRRREVIRAVVVEGQSTFAAWTMLHGLCWSATKASARLSTLLLPPSPFGRRFNGRGEGGVSDMAVSPAVVASRRRDCHFDDTPVYPY